MKKIFSLLAVACLPFAAAAQTFDSFMSAVEKHNSGYLAEKYNIDIAEANTQAAKVFNDPELSVEYGDNQDRVLMMGRSLEAGLSYSFNIGNPRKARISVARSEEEITRALVADYFRNLRKDAMVAWAEAWEAREMSSLKKSSAESMASLAASDSLRAAAGEIGRIDAKQSSIEARTFRGDWLRAQADYSNALTNLSVLSGGMPFSDIEYGDLRPAPVNLSVEALVAMALERRTDLKAALLSKDLSEKNLALVRAEMAPELGLNMGYSYNKEVRNEIAPAPKFNGVTVGVAIPLKFSSANKGNRKAAENAVLQADAAYEEACRQIEAEVRMAWASYQAALKAAEECSDSMLADAGDILESRMKAYRQGESSLLDYLLAVRVYNDTAESCIGAKAALFSSWAELLAAVGLNS